MGRHFLLLFISSYISSPANKIKEKSSQSGEWGRRHHTSSVSTCLLVWRKRGSTDVWGAREMNVGEEWSRLTALVQLPSFLFHFIVKEKNENTEKGNYLLSRQILGNVYSMIFFFTFFLKNWIHDATCIQIKFFGWRCLCIINTHTPKQLCTIISVKIGLNGCQWTIKSILVDQACNLN